MLTMQSLAAKRRIKGKRGFTLMEILIVLAIIAMLVGLIGTNIFARYNKAQKDTTAVQIKNVMMLLDQLKLDIGRYPTDDEGLQILVTDPGVPGWNGPYTQGGTLPQDAWKHDFHYQAPADADGEPVVMSFGADDKEGGTGSNGDVASSLPAG